MAILVYGSFVPDIVYRVARLPHKGEDLPASGVRVVAAGGGGNVAVALAGWGYRVRAGGNSVGIDALGTWMASELARLGISLPEHFVSPSGVTAPNGILVTPDGERTIIGNDYARVTWLPVTDWDGVSAVMVDAYSGDAGSAVIGEAAGRALPVVGADRTGSELAGLSVLLWSAAEHPEPAEARAAAMRGPWVAVTSGSGPIVVWSPDGSVREIRPPAQVVRDTTGAGDIFAASVTAGVSDGADVPAALERAADVAARYVARSRDSEIPPLTSMGS